MKTMNSFIRLLLWFILMVISMMAISLLFNSCVKEYYYEIPVHDTVIVYVDTNDVNFDDIEDIVIPDIVIRPLGIYKPDTIYETVVGDQTWMATDLDVAYLNDSTLLPIAISDAEWSVNTPVRCYHDGVPLYNWYAIGTGKLCPVGWHVPTDDDWQILVDFIGDDNFHKLKSANGEWNQQINDEFNMYNFNAVPVISRWYNGYYYPEDINTQNVIYWSSSIDSIAKLPVMYSLINHHNDISRWRHSYNMGYVVRCIKDK